MRHLDPKRRAVVKRYKASRPFGKTLTKSQALPAVFPEFVNDHIFELHHVDAHIWLGVRYVLTEQPEEDGSYVRILNWVGVHPVTA